MTASVQYRQASIKEMTGHHTENELRAEPSNFTQAMRSFQSIFHLFASNSLLLTF